MFASSGLRSGAPLGWDGGTEQAAGPPPAPSRVARNRLKRLSGYVSGGLVRVIVLSGRVGYLFMGAFGVSVVRTKPLTARSV